MYDFGNPCKCTKLVFRMLQTFGFYPSVLDHSRRNVWRMHSGEWPLCWIWDAKSWPRGSLLTIGLSPSILKYSVCLRGAIHKPKVNAVRMGQDGRSREEEEPLSLALRYQSAFGYPHLWYSGPYCTSLKMVSLTSTSISRSMALRAHSNCITAAQRKRWMMSRVCSVPPATWAGGHWCQFLLWEKHLSFMMSDNLPSNKCSMFPEALLSL